MKLVWSVGRRAGPSAGRRRAWRCLAAGVLGLCFGFTGYAEAAYPVGTPVAFVLTNDVGFGNSVCVLGEHPALGGGNPVTAPVLRWSPGNVWTGLVALPPGSNLAHRFIRRNNAASSWGAATNLAYLTSTSWVSVAAGPPAPYRGKTILFHSGFTNAFIVYNGGAGWREASMTRVGAGRSVAESLFRVDGIGEAGEPIQFVFHNGQGTYDKSPHPGYGLNDYYTPLDVFFVQDGQVFNYRPPPVLSAPRIVTTNVNSTAAGIPGRVVRIYLPRGYDQNTARRYPVLYFHDGQNVFDPGGAFGSWSADATATREISQGRMRECILVGVDNNATNRLVEYCPPTDTAPNTSPARPGNGSNYLSFLIDNVRPTLDYNYRTTNDPPNTLTMGSSMGGLISLYAGYSRPTFGKVGVMSSAIWGAPNFLASLDTEARRDLRIYTDWGTAESSANILEYWYSNFTMYDALLKQGYALNRDLMHVVGIGAVHNEAAWAARLPAALRFLLSPWDEPNELARELFPPQLRIESAAPGAPASFEGGWLNGDRLHLERSGDLTMTNWPVAMVMGPETSPWARRTLVDSNAPVADRQFWRMRRVR
jgi:predicted alpha/beta superfamily hydrolase